MAQRLLEGEADVSGDGSWSGLFGGPAVADESKGTDYLVASCQASAQV